ncbi:MAG: hypothetical protein IJ260_07105 [Butyrivibrio sp.]|nr:hypothetical protein [Butyrivibrio sp.]
MFKRSGTILKLGEDDSIILPKTSDINSTKYEITYDLTADEKSQMPTAIAKVNYTFSGVPIGCAYVFYNALSSQELLDNTVKDTTIYINVKILLLAAVGLLIVISLLGTSITRLLSNKKHSSRSDRIRFNRRKREFRKSRRSHKF